MHTTQSLTTGSRRLARVALIAVAVGVGSATQAAVMEYQLMPGSAYERTRLDAATQLPVGSASVGIGGTIRIDTATGALVSAQFVLGDYVEFYDYAPLTPFTNYAVVDHHNEQQNIAAGSGVVAGTVISFSGWTATATGSADCSAAAGAQGNATCASPTLAGWGAFDIDLLFTPDFSAVFGSTGWTDSLAGTTDNHSLNLFAVRVEAVPIPGAVWLMGSGLAGLLAVQRRRIAR